MDKLKIRRSYFQTFLDFLPRFGPFGNRLPTVSRVQDIESDFARLEIRSGRFPRLILSLHQQFAFNGLNSIFSPYVMPDNNNSGTRAQLLLTFGKQQ
ncbi:hypothetical protein AVEN_166817-1 [Araneus ventricosus]|uniref:Uncharacterized protein n=1 Tax=Araneus ventricosus TaxID=182803 RepID=A0A4Y2BNZ4_ARAVE|nr:hypothetical protein AVEN_166817-1 [Araneus ventricosus]